MVKAGFITMAAGFLIMLANLAAALVYMALHGPDSTLSTTMETVAYTWLGGGALVFFAGVFILLVGIITDDEI